MQPKSRQLRVVLWLLNGRFWWRVSYESEDWLLGWNFKYGMSLKKWKMKIKIVWEVQKFELEWESKCRFFSWASGASPLLILMLLCFKNVRFKLLNKSVKMQNMRCRLVR